MGWNAKGDEYKPVRDTNYFNSNMFSGVFTSDMFDSEENYVVKVLA